MEFCIISPIAGLERYARLSKTHMVLSHVTGQKYWDFYRERVKDGDLVILDCGAYENAPFDFERYVDRIQALEPDVVVMPDIIMSERSIYRSLAMKDLIDGRIAGLHEWMFIPQAANWEDWYKTMRTALDIGGFEWIGIPRHLIGTAEDPSIRFNVAKMLRKTHPDIKVHAMGYGGTVHELYYLAQAGVKSIDSSAPVWRGFCGYDLTAQWPDIPCRFDEEAPNPIMYEGAQSKHQLVLNNLEACGVDTETIR